jgi:hypothetical protein
MTPKTKLEIDETKEERRELREGLIHRRGK